MSNLTVNLLSADQLICLLSGELHSLSYFVSGISNPALCYICVNHHDFSLVNKVLSSEITIEEYDTLMKKNGGLILTMSALVENDVVLFDANKDKDGWDKIKAWLMIADEVDHV